MGSITSNDFCENQQNFNWLGLFKSVVDVLPSLVLYFEFQFCFPAAVVLVALLGHTAINSD